MKVIVASDKFRGSLSAADVARHVSTGLRTVLPDVGILCRPVADGGEGTLAAALHAGFERVAVSAEGPTGQPRDTGYAVRDGVAVVELADVSGLGRLPAGSRAALTASSYGTGQVLRAALDAGVARIVLGVGGSACTDGGAGMLQALGAQLRDEAGADIGRGGGALSAVRHLDLSGLHPRLADAELTLASDVDSPLRDAAPVYGPQKGASDVDVQQLAAALARWAQVVTAATGADLSEAAGSGAAGGVGYAALAVLGAARRSGAELVLELVGLPDQLGDAALVITGEGCVDAQTLRGKAPAAVAGAARAVGVPVVAVAGRCELPAASLAAAGIRRVYALNALEPDPQRCLRAAGVLVERVAVGIAQDWLLDAG